MANWLHELADGKAAPTELPETAEQWRRTPETESTQREREREKERRSRLGAVSPPIVAKHYVVRVTDTL